MDDGHERDIPGRESEAPLGSLLFVVFTSIFEVFLLCLSGYILASRGIIDKKTQKQLNRLNVSLFTPALLFSKVAFFLNPEKLRELWVIPIFFIVVTLVSMSVAAVLGWLFGLKRSQRSFAMAAAMFMNSNSLPIALMQSLVITVPNLQWDDDDNMDSMLGRALTYLVMYSTLGMVLRWSYGVHLLSRADTEHDTPANEDEHSPLLGSYNTDTSEPPSTLTGNESDDNHAPKGIISPPQPRRHTTFYNSFPNSPNQSRGNVANYEPISGSTSATGDSTVVTDCEDDSEVDEAHLSALPTHLRERRRHNPVVTTPKTPSKPRHFFARSIQRVRWFLSALNGFMTAPLWAALGSLVVACVAPLQHALDHDIQPLKGAIASAGNCSIPITLIVLGAYFYQPPKEGEETPVQTLSSPNTRKPRFLARARGYLRLGNQRNEASKEATRPGETKTVIIAVASRMLITPILLMPMMVLVTVYDYHDVFQDPVFVLAIVLLISSPPALTLAQITQAASGEAFERLISRTIFWAYCIITPITTIIYVVIGLMLARLP